MKNREEHLLLQVVRDGSGFRVVDRQVVALPLPLEPTRGSATWQFEALDLDGQTFFTRGIEDPDLLRGEFQNAEEPGRMDGYRLKGTRPASFLVRLPAMDVRRLEIFERPPGGDGRRIWLGGVSLERDSTSK
jgi:hypothetical protein